MADWSMPEGRRVALPGRGTTYVREVAGPSGAPTVMLLHGLGATSAINWPGAFEALRPHFRVIAVDHRGHGRGIGSHRSFRLQDCADDIVALADVLGIERIVPVGYSMGGPIALYAARRHPDRVQAMVLCATSATFSDADGPPPAASGMLPATMRLMPTPMRRQMVRTMMAATGTGDLPPLFVEEARRHDPAALLEAINAVRRFDARPWIGGLQTPAAVVVTALDRLVPPGRQFELARLTGASVHRVEADHGVAVRAPRVVPAGPRRRLPAGHHRLLAAVAVRSCRPAFGSTLRPHDEPLMRPSETTRSPAVTVVANTSRRRSISVSSHTMSISSPAATDAA